MEIKDKREEKKVQAMKERIKRIQVMQDPEHLAKQMNELNNLSNYCFLHHCWSPCQYCTNED